MVMKFIFALVLIAAANAQEELPPVDVTETPPPPPVTCSAAMDILFVVDSSSSVTAPSFQLIRDFLSATVSEIEIGRSLGRVSIARYNSWVDERMYFNTFFDKQSVLDSIANMPYYGQGTKTATALEVANHHLLQKYNGWREGQVPTVVIVLTDGRSQDIENLPKFANLVKAKATRVVAIGIGSKVNESELAQIASLPTTDNVVVVSDFTELRAEVDSIVSKTCEASGDVNECLENNGGCAQYCFNLVGSNHCGCRRGYTLAVDTVSCNDINECLDNNGGCSDLCENTDGSYKCSCPAGRITAGDGKTCIDDSCYGNTACQQQCINVVDGDFFCRCNSGYQLMEDGVSCADINECLVNNGGCESTCNNTMGSYVCVCPEGYGLRADGHTCGVMCYTCSNALSNEDCLDAVVCAPNQKSCQTTTRRENGVLYISKMCKQTEACGNNFIQNPRTAWSPSQCNVQPDGSSVCRCCCHDSLCNVPGDCTIADDINIKCPDPSLLDLPAGMNMTCNGNELGDTCTLTCPVGYGPVGGSHQIVCSQVARTFDGYWLGDIGTCGDINECAVNNGGCSHTCTNTNGSYFCSCPGNNPCGNQKLDLFFILDQSSSIKQGNFDLMLNFVSNTVAELNVGQDAVRVGLITYNKAPYRRFNLNQVHNQTQFNEFLDAIVYKGRGTKTALAINNAVSEDFTVARGRRPGVPLAVVVITDGRSYDWRDLPAASKRLHEAANVVYAIGVSKRVNEHELLQIAGSTANYIMVDNFSDLDAGLISLLNDKLCVDPEPPQFLTSDQHTCDFDECSVANGGCSHNCTNTVGSYYCTCPPDMSIVEDGVTCDLNECAVDNGGCAFKCVNKLGGYSCICPSHQVVSGNECLDHDECLDENGGCSHTCVNLEPGYECTCPEGMIIGADKQTCEIDSCYNQVFPMQCAQICTNEAGGSYRCSCEPGYTLNEDAHNCTEIDECEFSNGGCEHTCTNTPGSFICECPAGMMLRADGRTCGILCYTCQNLPSNEECNEAVACAPSQDACFTTMRTRDNITMITKGCQQVEACINNMIQNPRDAGEGPSQCNPNLENSKCECCCLESLCNAALCPYNFTLPGCESFTREYVSFRGLQDNGEVFPGGVAVVTCPTGFTYSQNGAAPTQLNCNYNFQNNTAAWDGEPEDLDTCVDIDECLINNGGCVAPAICANLPGSYECVCPSEPADYVLIDGMICERDECADIDQGGCTHNCTNTIGSYVCFCPPMYSLLEDGLTCDPDECMDANGGCAELCVNTLMSFECRCHNEGSIIGPDGKACIDVNECLTANGGCSDNCTNLTPGYECSCPVGFLLNADGLICRPDPCYGNNGGCSHICTEGQDGSAVCSCPPGFETLDDGSCIDINECLVNNGGCQNNCTNTEGSYVCLCPDGEALRDDKKTCGRACYSCEGAATNEECNAQPLEVCAPDADSCENEVRVNEGRKLIFKRCKQTKSCNNNYIQNPRTAWMPTQCNGESENDVCRCCCTGHACNANEKPCAAAQICHLKSADLAVIVDSSSSVKYDNFQKMKSFTSALFNSFIIGQDKVHSALIRYNRDVDVRFNFASVNSRSDVIDAVDMMPYMGSGTRTGKAVQYVADNIFKPANGARDGVTKIVITITDGKSQDDVLAASEQLRAMGAVTFAVGIGDKLNEVDLDQLAGNDNRRFIAENFDALSGLVLNQIQEAVCHDQDECSVANGGCSHECVNTRGSFYCKCPDDMQLDVNARDCVARNNVTKAAVDECAMNNGGCSDICLDTLEGFICECSIGYTLGPDNMTCFDTNECDNSPCSHNCVNIESSFFCECPEDHYMDVDSVTCLPRAAVADCMAGYMAYGHSCMRATNESSSYDEAEGACGVNGGRLVIVQDDGVRKIVSRNYGGDKWIGLTDRAEEGVFVNSDGSAFTYTAGWADDQPGAGDCGYLDYMLYTSSCASSRMAICEIPRSEGFVVFSRTWPNGAQGKLYFPTGVNAVTVTFPQAIKNINVWFGSVSKVSSSQYTITQNDIERQSSNGQAEFVIDMSMNRFPDYQVSVVPYTEPTV